MSENTYQMDGFVYISPNYDETSSNANYFLSIGGDSIRLVNQRTPTINSPGFIGEFCFDNNFLYYCYATNQWGKIALSKSW
jgi:hypothetical protein